MKISAACLFLVAALSVHNTNTVEARPLIKRDCYHGSGVIFTNYWVPREGEKDEDNDGNKMKLSGKKSHAIKGTDGDTIAMVDDNTWEKCDMEGTCVVNDDGEDTLVNLANDGGKNAKFETVNKNRPFGQGSKDNPLRPFVSVAANDLAIGTLLFIKELLNFKLPNGRIHNGCVVVDDEGWSFDGCQLDFFVLTYENYLAMKTPEHVTVIKKKCKILDYTTAEDYKFVGAKTPKGVGKGKGKGPKEPKKPKEPKGGDNKPKGGDNKPKPKDADNESCDEGGTFIKTYQDTSFGGSESCSAGDGCHELSDSTKSAKWSNGKKATFYRSSDCSGETLYEDSQGEDEDISGNGDGFNAGSVRIE